MSVDVSRCSTCEGKKVEERKRRGGKKKEGEAKRKKMGEAGLSKAVEKDAPVCLCKTFCC